jgi:hypothetical protein
MEMKMTHDGVDEAIRAMGDAADEGLTKLAYRILELSQEYLADGGTDTGYLLESGFVEKVDSKFYIIGYTAPHAPPREFGSRGHMPPVEALIPWCRRHLTQSSPNKIISPKVGSFKGGRMKFRSDRVIRAVGSMLSTAHKIGLPFADKLAQVNKAVSEVKRAGHALKAYRKGLKKNKRNAKKDTDARSFAWALALSIKKRGTEPSPFLRPAMQVGQSELVKHVQEAVKNNAGGAS